MDLASVAAVKVEEPALPVTLLVAPVLRLVALVALLAEGRAASRLQEVIG